MFKLIIIAALAGALTTSASTKSDEATVMFICSKYFKMEADIGHPNPKGKGGLIEGNKDTFVKDMYTASMVVFDMAVESAGRFSVKQRADFYHVLIASEYNKRSHFGPATVRSCDALYARWKLGKLKQVPVKSI